MIDNLLFMTRRDLEHLVRTMAWNDAMGCHTRAGFEKWIWPEIYHKAKWIVYFDVDGVHALNEQSGTYDTFDGIMKQVLNIVRSTDIVSCQYLSGDEYLICLTESPDRKVLDPDGLVERLKAELAKHGLTAIFAVQPVSSSILAENVKPAADRVLEAKKARGIGR